MRGIYKIQNIKNGKAYVGQSIDIENRIKRHYRELKQGIHHNKHLQRSFDKYGQDYFTYEVIYEATQNEDLDELEKKYIEETKAYTEGYNSTIGGKGDLGLIVTDEFRERMRQLVLGERNPNFGNRWTPEMKQKLSEKVSDGSRKGGKNANATKVIRVEDCMVFDTESEAAAALGLKSAVSVGRCLKSLDYVAKGFHFVEYSDSIYKRLLDEKERFWYLYECYYKSSHPYVVDFCNHCFYTKTEFKRKINKEEGITTRKIDEILKQDGAFEINNKIYQLLVA